MNYRNHGGKCCGITQIYGFTARGPDCNLPAEKGIPSTLEEAVKAGLYFPYSIDTPPVKNVAFNYWRSQTIDYANDRRVGWPAQTAGERLKDFLRRIHADRSSGCVEAVLADYRSEPAFTNQYNTWDAFLKEIGFVEVNSFVNSNTQNTVHVYHFAYDNKSWMAKEAAAQRKKLREERAAPSASAQTIFAMAGGAS